MAYVIAFDGGLIGEEGGWEIGNEKIVPLEPREPEDLEWMEPMHHIKVPDTINIIACYMLYLQSMTEGDVLYATYVGTENPDQADVAATITKLPMRWSYETTKSITYFQDFGRLACLMHGYQGLVWHLGVEGAS